MNARFRRNAVGLILNGLFCLILLHGFLIDGLFVPLRINSCSMSPFLHGPSAILQCPECNAHYNIEAEDYDASETMVRVVCPVCSFTEVVSLSAVSQSGDRIFVDKAANSLRTSRRWETVLFRQSQDAQLAVKRIIGLPGETVKIQDGDIWINDQHMIKPFEQQLQMRIPVRHGRWEMRLRLPNEPNRWLTFHPTKPLIHSKPFEEIESKTQAGELQWIDTPITNQLPENQWRRHFTENQHRVDDLMLEFDWASKHNDTLQVHSKTGGETFDISFDVKKNIIRVDGEQCHETVPCDFNNRNAHKIVVSLFDRQLLIAVDQKVVLTHDMMQHVSSSDDRNESPFAIRLTSELYDQIKNLQIWRDVYYTALPDDLAAKQQPTLHVTVPEDHYFLLGDNSSFSMDSRVWTPPTVHQRQIIGTLCKMKRQN